MAGIKVRAKAKDDIVTIKALMSHPMESGRRKDKKSGELIPAHFINMVTITANDKAVITAEWTGSISKNPYFACKYKGAAGDTIKVSWVDNKGETGEVEAKAK
jgi:sulfur-oxidizing protein SoxZ